MNKMDVIEQLGYLKEYTQKHWDIPNLEAILCLIQKEASFYDCCAVDHDLFQGAADILAQRSAVLECRGQTAFVFDAMYRFLIACATSGFSMADAASCIRGPWDYSRVVDAIYVKVLAQYPEFSRVKPLGWEAALNAQAQDGEAIADSREMRTFRGVNSAGRGFPGFPQAISLPSVMYSEISQGRCAAREFTAAVFSHLLYVMSYNHREEVAEELATLPVEEERLFFDLEWACHIKNPYLKLLLKEIESSLYSEAQYLENLRQAKAFEALSPEAKVAHKLKNAEAILASLAKPKADSVRKDAQMQKDSRIAFLRSEFSVGD